MSISFTKTKSHMRLLSPQQDFSLTEIPFEIRMDPLTRESSRVFDLPYSPPGRSNTAELVERSKEMFCPFCPEVIEKSTPLFPKELVPEGRVRVGNACLVPNPLPLDKYTGVSVISDQHYIPMKELTAETMMDAFLASQVFIKAVAEADPRATVFSINWNYMPEAGSSIIHPHLQVTCGETPTNHLRLQIEGSNKYLRENGKSFWEDFIRAEKLNGIRYVGEMDSTFWVMSYAPQSFLPDIWCIFAEPGSLKDVGKDTLRAFLEGLSKVLGYFASENICSFNMSLFSVRGEEGFRTNARILPRLLLRAIGNSDHTYYQTAHKEPCCVRPPESDCPKVKNMFQHQAYTLSESSGDRSGPAQ